MTGQELHTMWRDSCGEELGNAQVSWWHLQHIERMAWTRLADKIAEDAQVRANDMFGQMGRV